MPTHSELAQVYSNQYNVDRDREDSTTILGLSDIPNHTVDLFGPFSDRDLFNKTFEDLCISDDDSDFDNGYDFDQ